MQHQVPNIGSDTRHCILGIAFDIKGVGKHRLNITNLLCFEGGLENGTAAPCGRTFKPLAAASDHKGKMPPYTG